MPYQQLMRNISKQKREADVKAADLVKALEKHGLRLNVAIACQVIEDMHRMAGERRLKAITEATT